MLIGCVLEKEIETTDEVVFLDNVYEHIEVTRELACI